MSRELWPELSLFCVETCPISRDTFLSRQVAYELCTDSLTALDGANAFPLTSYNCLYCKDDTCDGGVASEWREEIRHRTQAARRDGQRRSRVVIGCTLGAGADLAQASFAGQHDTYLNITGTAAHA